MSSLKYKKNLNLKSNWQDLDSKTTFITFTKDKKKFNQLQLLAYKKKCNTIICRDIFEKTIKINDKTKFIYTANIEEYSIKIADAFFDIRGIKIIIVTGTNGKSSISYGLSKVLNKENIKTSYIGTLGFYANKKRIKKLNNTTPDYIELMNLIELSKRKYGCKFVILEASSIGFKEKRLGNLKGDLGILTNLGNDHLDYHQNIKNYHNSKIELLLKHIKKDSKILIQADISNLYIKKLSQNFTIINQSNFIKENNLNIINNNLNTIISIGQKKIKTINLPYNFVIDNMITIWMSIASLNIKYNYNNIFNNYFIKGRHQVILNKNNKLVIVDYAHTPDGLFKLLSPYKNSNEKKIIVFGCGGDRDKVKRSQMASIANNLCDFQIITDDNPRYENPVLIRRALSKYCKNFFNIASRLLAIKKGFNILNKYNGILFIVGKGHEEIQIYKDKQFRFSDIKVSKEIAKSIK